eukprot:jgi/Phyca11/99406/e_gw1.3.513.1
MDKRVWAFYLRSLLHDYISEPSVLLVGNLECHVSAASEEIVAGELVSTLQPLPKKSPPRYASQTDRATTAREKRLSIIKRTIRAWESIKTTTVTKAFNKTLDTKF